MNVPKKIPKKTCIQIPKEICNKVKLVHLVLHPHRIAPTFLNLDSWSSGKGFIPIISTKRINQIKKDKL